MLETRRIWRLKPQAPFLPQVVGKAIQGKGSEALQEAATTSRLTSSAAADASFDQSPFYAPLGTGGAGAARSASSGSARSAGSAAAAAAPRAPEPPPTPATPTAKRPNCTTNNAEDDDDDVVFMFATPPKASPSTTAERSAEKSVKRSKSLPATCPYCSKRLGQSLDDEVHISTCQLVLDSDDE